jgi:hypothetical protein
MNSCGLPRQSGRGWVPKPRTEELPETAKAALARIVRLLLGGFTGQISLECSQGGIHCMEERRRVRAKDFSTTDVENLTN